MQLHWKNSPIGSRLSTAVAGYTCGRGPARRMSVAKDPIVRVLLVENDAADRAAIEQALAFSFQGRAEIHHADCVARGIGILVGNSWEFDVILLDTNLPDSSGLQGFGVLAKVTQNAVPIIILSSEDDETMAEQAVEHDAQDFLCKADFTAGQLARAIRFATQRHKTRLALEENRERFRQFARVSSDRIWETDREFRFPDAPGTLADDSLPTRGDLIGKTPWEVSGFRPLTEDGWEGHRQVLAGHEAFREFEVVYADDAGGETYWSISGEPVFHGGGNFAGYRGTATDITDRKRAEAELAAASESLAQMNGHKDKFFSIIAHDLRSPFAGVVGTADLFRRGIVKPDADSIVESGELMYAAATRAYNLVEDLLEWSRLQLGGVSFTPQAFDVAQAVQETLDQANLQAEAKDIEIEVAAPLGFRIVADRQAVNAVLRNLIGNAVKFTPEGGRITVDAGRLGGMVEISVTDNGVGMPAEKLDKLFSIAEQTSTPGTAGERGTGLGLVLCKELIEMNGGEIAVETVRGEGTTVRFTVPAEGAGEDKGGNPHAVPEAEVDA